MYKVRYNDTTNLHEDLFSAKKEALLTFKKNKNVKLIEVLDDNDNVILSQEREEPTEVEVDNAIDSLIREKIARTWEFINDYESMLITLTSEEIGDDSISTKINDILDDLHIHVGVLESCLSDYEETIV